MSSLCPSLDDDRISNLPVALKQTILDLLPLHDAARTCILSKAWREAWTMRPVLDLDKPFYLQVISKKSEEAKLSAFSAAVDKILSVHTGPILDIEMYIPPELHSHHIHPWIQRLSEKGVVLLKLDNSDNDSCLVPECFYDFAKLKGLILKKWILCPPPESGCFSKLLCVDLIDVWISAPISFGRQLQDLELRHCTGIEHLVFTNFGNLKRLSMVHCSQVDWRWLENLTSLEQLTLALTPAEFNKSKSVSLIRLLSKSTGISLLQLDDCLLEILGGPFTLRTHVTKMVNLNILDLFSIPYNLLRIANSLCLIRFLPNLQLLMVKLDFKVTSSNPENPIIEHHLESQDWKDVVLDKLETVQISGLVGLRSELQFAKLLLASSPSLGEMLLCSSRAFSDPIEKFRIQWQFLQLPRKSQQAQLFWFD